MPFADSRHNILNSWWKYCTLTRHLYMLRQGQICIHDFTQKPEPKVWSENDDVASYIWAFGIRKKKRKEKNELESQVRGRWCLFVCSRGTREIEKVFFSTVKKEIGCVCTSAFWVNTYRYPTGKYLARRWFVVSRSDGIMTVMLHS